MASLQYEHTAAVNGVSAVIDVRSKDVRLVYFLFEGCYVVIYSKLTSFGQIVEFQIENPQDLDLMPFSMFASF